jgi:hypothetical protein
VLDASGLRPYGTTAMATPAAEDIRLLVRLAQGDFADAERCLRSRSASLDELAETASAHGLSVVLLRALEGSPLRAALSSPCIQALEDRRRRQETRSQILLEALASLAERFASSGQPFVLLKGPYLAARFYGDVRGREFVDLDLLVPRADRGRALRLLAAAGYRRRSRSLFGSGLTSFFVHGFDFAAGNAYVDLHWDLSRHPSMHLDEPKVWGQRSSYPVDGRSYAVLSDEHEVLFAALSLLRDLERGRPKIKNVVDLIQIVAATDAEIDWEALLESSRSDGTFGPLVNVLGLCLDVADAHDLAPSLSAALARHADRRVRARCTDSPLRFRPARFGLGNKLWSARVHDTTLAAWLLWWATSLPFRVAVHRWRRP